MFSLLQSIYDLVAPRRSQTKETLYDEMTQGDLIETINEVGEKRYIEIPKSDYTSRRDKLEILLKKSQSLLDFCLKMKRNDDIKPLFNEFENIKKVCKRGSKSSVNLAVV